MIWLVAAAAAFLLIHLAISGTRVRDAITGAIGEGPYMGLFSLASSACLVWMSIAYVHAQRGGDDPVWWTATPVTKWIQLVVTFVAFMLHRAGSASRRTPPACARRASSRSRTRRAAFCASPAIRSSGAWRSGRPAT